jgi:hypothetical protein
LGEQKNLFLDLAAAVFSDPFAVKKAWLGCHRHP